MVVAAKLNAMKLTLLRAQCCAIGILLTLSPFLYAANTYPSALVSFVLTGYPEEPADADSKVIIPSKNDVAKWEDAHSDLLFGSDHKVEIQTPVIGYMYPQSINFDPMDIEFCLKKKVESSSSDYEDLFLHFSEDTVLSINNANSIASKTTLGGKPLEAGFLKFKESLGNTSLTYEGFASPTWPDDVEKHFYMYSFEKVESLQMTFSKEVLNERFVIEYLTNDERLPINPIWKPLNITHTLLSSKKIRIDFIAPNDWVRMVPKNPYTGKTLSFHRNDITEGESFYSIRIKSSKNNDALLSMKDLSIPRWMKVTKDGKGIFIPGWDPVNDRNGDGYVDAKEWHLRNNLKASARRKIQSRAVPTGRMGNPISSDNRTNLLSPYARSIYVDCLQDKWSKKNWLGAYVDDFGFLVGSNTFDVKKGGKILELHNESIRSEKMQLSYKKGLDLLLSKIDVNKYPYIAANISELNPYLDGTLNVSSLNTFIREFYLYPGIGLDGWSGLRKKWDVFALAKEGIFNNVMVHHKSGRAQKINNSKENWDSDKETSLALFYLVNIPELTSYTAWNGTWIYGSGNTQKMPTSYWKAGVPKNLAYLPLSMLKIDIGLPLTHQHKNAVYIHWEVNGNNQFSTQDEKIIIEDQFGQSRELSLLPANWVSLKSVDSPMHQYDGDVAIGREYSNGLVVYRTMSMSSSDEFYKAEAREYRLPGCYKRVGVDGSLAKADRTVSLRGYEGAVLLKDEANCLN